MSAAPPLSLKDARAALGVDARATAGELRRAFREAAKRAHPDRPGGDADRFRLVVEAYRRLSAPPPTHVFQPPAPRTPGTPVLRIDPHVACRGGVVSHMAGPRLVRISLPGGLRTGDVVRAGDLELSVVVHAGGDLMVRGDDLWLSVKVDRQVLAQGGRIVAPTPFGRRTLRLGAMAGSSGVVRIPGQGLPARGGHPQGHLFIRLSAAPEAAPDAAVLLRRFAAAWAA